MTDDDTRNTEHAARNTQYATRNRADRPRALIVEDNRSWQQILAEILTDAGLAVEVVDRVDAAVACLRAQPHRLAVVDLSLEGDDPHNQDGLRVLEAVRRQDPGCVSILLTGYATVELAVSVLTEYGVYTCLRKESFRRSEFRAAIDQALASRPDLEAGRATEGGPEAPLDEGARTEDEADAPPGRALVVEDDAGWRSILSELLSDAGYEVRLCSSYAEALGCLRREQYTVAIVDLSLEGSRLVGGGSAWGEPPLAQDLEGYRLLEGTRAARIPAIVVSGVASADDVEQAYAERGVFACLAKQTFQRRAFLQTLAEARAAAETTSELDVLTTREREVLELLAQGLTNKEIAEQLFITTNTVKRHLKSVFVKLEVHTRAAAAAKAVEAGVG